ncbi:MAG: D-glycero-D-manno-heptose 1,7-bisphosphate phosphatase [Alphaproteobacteria bacterium]|jgi:D-glycero-D-manno-heptose 1,7-bisphosphate phosphatase|nr:D-glycero-D-manno-heptose 1,7-bisphosphate phosphatase [Alphaproteobacteria bacterium]
MTRAVFLDRDGVLNEAIVRDGNPYPPVTVEQLVIIPGAADSLKLLHNHGFRLIVVTNQPDIARGKISREVVEEINCHLCQALPIDAVEMCDHDDADRCECRKPQPGMLLAAARRDGIDLARSFLVGDRWRDIEAGKRAGCRTILIGDGYTEGLKSLPDVAVASLVDAANWILAHSQEP